MILLWHRRLGLLLSPFILLAAVTGLLLAWSGPLGIAEVHLRQPAILRLFGITPIEQLQTYKAGDAHVSQSGQALYLDANPAGDLHGTLLGAVRCKDYWVVASGREILLLDFQGQLVERMPAPAGLGEILALGLDDRGRAVIRTDAEKAAYVADEQVTVWTGIVEEGLLWSSPAELPGHLRDAIFRASIGKGISLEKLVTDLHSGQLLGGPGRTAVALGGLLLMLLALSGVLAYAGIKKRSVSAWAAEKAVLRKKLAELEADNLRLRGELDRLGSSP